MARQPFVCRIEHTESQSFPISRGFYTKQALFLKKRVSHTTVERLNIRFQLIYCSQTRRSGENLASDGAAIATTVEILRWTWSAFSSRTAETSQSLGSLFQSAPAPWQPSSSASSGALQRAAVPVREAGRGDAGPEASEAAVHRGIRHHAVGRPSQLPLPEAVPGVGSPAAGPGHWAAGHHRLLLQAAHDGQPLGLASRLQHLQSQLKTPKPSDWWTRTSASPVTLPTSALYWKHSWAAASIASAQPLPTRR